MNGLLVIAGMTTAFLVAMTTDKLVNAFLIGCIALAAGLFVGGLLWQ